MSKEFEKELAKIVLDSLYKTMQYSTGIFELIPVHNRFCDENNYSDSMIMYSYKDYALDGDLNGKQIFADMEINFADDYTTYEINSSPMFFDGYGKITKLTHEQNPYDFELIATWIVENDLFDEYRFNMLDYDRSNDLGLYDLDVEELEEKFENKVEKKSSFKP